MRKERHGETVLMHDHDGRPSTQAPAQVAGREKPREAYETASRSLAYRLSEITFGSLVASYVVGFIGFSAWQSTTANSFADIPRALVVALYLFISTAYFFGTGGLYIVYHACILTLPSLQFRHIFWDFGIAGLQAALFGLSMLYPNFFIVWTWVLVLVVTYRKHRARVELQTSLRDTTRDAQGWDSEFKRFLRTKEHALTPWAPLGRLDIIVVLLVTVSAIAVIVGSILARSGWLPWLTPKIQFAVSISIATTTVIGLVFRVSRYVNEHAAMLPTETALKRMNTGYAELLRQRATWGEKK